MMTSMSQITESPAALPFLAPSAPKRACRISCQGCGACADVELEVLVPSALRLRCLACGDHRVAIAEKSPAAISLMS